MAGKKKRVMDIIVQCMGIKLMIRNEYEKKKTKTKLEHKIHQTVKDRNR